MVKVKIKVILLYNRHAYIFRGSYRGSVVAMSRHPLYLLIVDL